jgi:3-isopropylmalate/(R)-2-methylmalate dehydratase small subunit
VVDLAAQRIITPEGAVIPFAIDGASRHRLLNGLDDIGVTLQSADLIREYEERRCQEAPWLFLSS